MPYKRWDLLDREAYLVDTLRELHEDLSRARKQGRESGKMPTLVSTLRKEARIAREELDELRAKAEAAAAGDEVEDATDDELLDMSLEALRELPPVCLEPLAEVLAERLGRAAMVRIADEVARRHLRVVGEDDEA